MITIFFFCALIISLFGGYVDSPGQPDNSSEN
jgi:hypothetical protein